MYRGGRPSINLGKVGFLGDPYSFTHLAARRVVGRYHPDLRNPDCKLVGMNSNSQIVRAVAEEAIDTGVVPIQNIGGGTVTEVVDGLYKHRRSDGVVIVDSQRMPISMCIGGKCDSSQVRKVVSKNVALYQSSLHLGGNYPDARWEAVDSTSEGVRLVADRKRGYRYAAALGAREAFDKFGVDVYSEDVQNTNPNVTRFVLLKKLKRGRGRRRTETLSTGKSRKGIMDVTTVAVTPHRSYTNLPGELAKLANDSGVVVKNSYSRPTGSDTKILFLDICGYRSDDNVRRFLDRMSRGKLGEKSSYIELGSYPYEDFFEQGIKTVGVIGVQPRINKMLTDFFKRCGYDTLEANQNGWGCRTHGQYLTRNSDVVIANRPGRKGLRHILKNIGCELGDGKLLVINSSDPHHLRQAMEGKELGCNVLYMDAPIVKSVPLAGQNIIFLSDQIAEDLNFPPGSIESEFIANYDNNDASVTVEDFGGHGVYRGYSNHGSNLASYVLLRWANMLGVDFKRLRRHQSPTEAILADAAQKTVAYGRAAPNFHRYVQSHGDQIRQLGNEIARLPDCSMDEIQELFSGAVKSSNDVDGAIKRTTSLFKFSIGSDGVSTDPKVALRMIRELSGQAIDSFDI
jgi:prephenate dehydratase